MPRGKGILKEREIFRPLGRREVWTIAFPKRKGTRNWNTMFVV